jgi:SRSO17 transposase
MPLPCSPRRGAWDADGVRDDLRGYVTGHLGDPGAVLVVDETGDVKKGTGTAGVQRQYTGTAGRIENAQVAVYLSYAAPAGHALIDRELYPPKSWTDDPGRCRAAGIPDHVEFATKPALARRMIARAIAAKVPFGWAAADEVYGDNGPLRTWLEDGQVRYVLAVSCDHRVPVGAGGQPGPMSWPPGCPGGPGSGCPPGPAPKATATTTGPGSPSPTPAQGAAGC